MTGASYLVVCDLSLQNFDDRRAGYAAAKGAYAEVRRLGRLDQRIRSTRMRRNEPLVVQIAITVEATTPREAFDHCGTILRSALHAIGGSTAGWERLRPQVRRAPTSARRRWGRPVPSPAAPLWEPSPDWAACSAAAQRAATASRPLPPLVTTAGGDVVIDLR